MVVACNRRFPTAPDATTLLDTLAMLLQRTAKAHEELQPGKRHLPLRERSVLLMAGGKTLAQLQQLLGDEHAALVKELIAQGYLQTDPIPAATKPSHQASIHQPEPAEPAAASAAADSAGRQTLNLPGTRMYLFDLCERMFANRLHDTAHHLRQMLREARDVDSMLHARDQLLRAVHLHAGAERAEALRQQLADMLPERSLDTPS